MNIDLELYRIFYIVAKHENISKATRELYISQPAITQRINNLERQLNIKLFYRRPEGMKLTEEGKKLYNYVKDSMETMSNVENQFTQYLQKSNDIGSYIKIELTDITDDLFLCDALIRFSKEHPNIAVRVDNGTEEDAIRRITNGEIDIITIKGKTKINSRNLKVIANRKLTLCLYTSTKYVEKEGEVLDIYNNAQNYTFILPRKDSRERKEFDKFCQRNSLNIQSKYETQSINIRKYFVLNGLGIAVGFREYIKEELEQNVFIEIPLEESFSECDINWIITKDKETKEEVLKFIEIIKAI